MSNAVVELAAHEEDVRIRNGAVAWRHIEAEFADDVEVIMDTLVPEEPYAYTCTPELKGDGAIPTLRTVSTKAELRSVYEDLHRVSLVQSMSAIAEVRGDWYVYMFGIGRGSIKPTGTPIASETSVLFPTMGKEGITGELFWYRSSIEAPYKSEDGGISTEVAILEKHEALLECFRNADVDGVIALCDPRIQTAVRNYVEETGMLVTLNDADQLAGYLKAFFDKYEVLDVSLVQRHVSKWNVFCELRWTVKESGSSKVSTFFTAEHSEVRSDGLFGSRIGHGTERVAA